MGTSVFMKSFYLWRFMIMIILHDSIMALQCHAASIETAKVQLSPAVDLLITEYWNWRLDSRPEYASYIGIPDNDNLLDNITMAEFRSRYEKSQYFYQKASDLQENHTSHVDARTLRALKYELQVVLDGHRYEGYLTPISYLEGIHKSFEKVLSCMVFENLSDYFKFIARLRALPIQLQQTEELMKEGVTKGIVQHNISMKGVPEMLDVHIVEKAEDSRLWTYVSNITASDATEEDIEEVRNTVRGILVDEIAPAFKAFKDYIETEYLPNTRPEIGISSLHDGPARYQAILKYHTSTNLTAREIHDIGLAEVDRITMEMQKIITELGYNLSVPDFSEKLRNDKNNLFETADECMEAFMKTIEDDTLPRMPELFLKVPKSVLEVIEDSSPFGMGASYSSGSIDGTRPGRFLVNTYYLESQPKYNMMSLALHEAYPGHHLQRSYVLEDETMPTFRRVSERRCYCYAPSMFPTNSAFVEGWGLYSEILGFDLELYKDPLVRYGHFSMEIFRAGRMVVDTGLHAFGWSRQKALDYMIKHTAESKANLENEIDRYITWPGQAVAYKIGQMKIQELRKTASEVLGDDFDIRVFHDIVLQSIGPLDLLEDEVNNWIANGGRREM